MRRTLVSLALLLGALAAAAGCSLEPILPLAEEPDVRRRAASESGPMPFSVAVAPVQVARSRDDATSESASRFQPALRPEKLQKAFSGVLEAGRAFRKVTVLEPTGQDGHEALLARARAGGADLLVTCRVLRCEHAYKGTNGWYLPNLVLWFLVMAPSWWVADEVFGAEMQVEVLVHSVHSGKLVHRNRRTASVEEDLDDFDRGHMFFGILRVPGALDSENWEKVTALLQPRLVRSMQLALLAEMGGPFRTHTESPDFHKDMSKRLALVVGVSNHRHYQLPKIWFSASDAEAVSAFLEGSKAAGFEKRNVEVLTDQQAGGADIRAALQRVLVDLARPSDVVFLYFAGYGSMAAGRETLALHLLPHDADAGKVTESSLSFGELKSLVDRCQARTVVMVLDAAFQSSVGGRSYYKGDPVPPESIEKELKRLASRKGVFLLTAAAAGEACGEDEAQQRGLFTHALLKGLAGEADEDRDGRVTLDELHRFTAERVFERALLQGRSQNPRLYGEGAHELVLAALKRPEPK